MNPYLASIFLPVILSLILGTRKTAKKRGVPVDVGSKPGYVIRNYRFAKPVESHWQGISTLAELFEQSCKKFAYMPLFGSRKLISRETEVSPDGRSFEKLHLGEYEWISYGEAFKAVCNFASGLVHLGHGNNERVAIFADTKAEWQIALQVYCINLISLLQK